MTAIGLHIEGFVDLHAGQVLARKAHAKSIPLVALKVGRSDQAKAATVSHTASIAGRDAGAQALLDHLRIARVNDLTTLIETLKILHVAGPLSSAKIASVSYSGGEASLIADLAHDTPLTFPLLNDRQTQSLSDALGPKVTLANPLDYHTYIWRDTDAMTAAFSAIIDPSLAITFLIVGFPRADLCDATDWDCAIDAAIATRARTSGTIAMVATLPELMPEDVAQRLIEGGVIPMNGLTEALAAAVAAQPRAPADADLIIPTGITGTQVLSEDQAKPDLSAFGLVTPNRITGSLDKVCEITDQSSAQFVLKSTGSAHKTDKGGVVLSLRGGEAVRQAGQDIGGQTFLLEEMINDSLAELLIGVVKDEAHGFVITIAAGGIFTEILDDRASTLLPATAERLEQILYQLKTSKILAGYRGRPAAKVDRIIDAILAIQSYVLANLDTVEEVEVNPLIITPSRAIAVDALIRKRHDTA